MILVVASRISAPMHPSNQSRFDLASLADFLVQFLAIAYGVFATATDFKETTADGKKHLAKVGRIGIAFLVTVSIAGISVKIYQHQKEAKAKIEADAAQQKMVQDLEQSLSNSRVISKSLGNADAKLTKEADTLREQSEKMNGLLQGTQDNLHATSRVLDPLDDSVDVSITEIISRSDPSVQTYLTHLRPDAADLDSEPSLESALPRKEDGDFGAYAIHHVMTLVIDLPSSISRRSNPKAIKFDDRQFVTANIHCVIDGSASFMGYVDVDHEKIKLIYHVKNVKLSVVGSVRSYIDLKNATITLTQKTFLSDHLLSSPGEEKAEKPTLSGIWLDISGKVHDFSISKFNKRACDWKTERPCSFEAEMPEGKLHGNIPWEAVE